MNIPNLWQNLSDRQQTIVIVILLVFVLLVFVIIFADRGLISGAPLEMGS